MKTTIVSLLAGCAVLFTVGCATQKTVHQRGWIGGEYAEAKPPHWLDVRSAAGPTVYAFPDQLKTQQSSAVFVSAVFSNTPAAVAGLRPGDLILKIDDRPVRTLKSFREFIDGCAPGTRVRLTLFREGCGGECTLVTGREQYEKWRSASLKLGLSGSLNLDLVPNPDFSLVVLGYRRTWKRLELHSPEEQFARGVRAREEESAPWTRQSEEGWHTWLTVLNLQGYKRILAQQIMAEGAPQTADTHAGSRRLRPACGLDLVGAR